MSGGRERDSGVHDRTINETSSEEEEESARNPLGIIAEEGNKGNEVVINPIQVAGNPQNPESDDDMANNAVKPGQHTALPTFDGERGEGFTNW